MQESAQTAVLEVAATKAPELCDGAFGYLTVYREVLAIQL
jgi:hypothetical protein